MKSSSKRDMIMKIEGGLKHPGSPAQMGFKSEYVNGSEEGESWERSTDFIVAFRVRKIWYHRGDIKNKPHKDKVVMQDGAAVTREPTLTLQSDDDISLEDLFVESSLAAYKVVEDDEEVQWIVPDVGLDCGNADG